MARSQMNFKLPDELIEALKHKAVEQGSTATDLVIQGIRLVLGLEPSGIDKSVDNSIDTGIYEQLQRIEERIDNLELSLEKLPA